MSLLLGSTAVQAAAHTDTDAEGQQKKLKYPKQIAFIISNEFCERFNYYGMRSKTRIKLFHTAWLIPSHHLPI